MKNYITWTGLPVEGGIRHPNTSDIDKTATDGKIDFIQYGYEFNGVNLAIIEYDETITTQEDLVAYAQIEPAFNLTLITEEEANTLLATLGEVSVENFIFTDERPVDNF